MPVRLLSRSIRPAARVGSYPHLLQGFDLRCIWMNGMDILIEYKKKKGKKPAITAKNDGTIKKKTKEHNNENAYAAVTAMKTA